MAMSENLGNFTNPTTLGSDSEGFFTRTGQALDNFSAKLANVVVKLFGPMIEARQVIVQRQVANHLMTYDDEFLKMARLNRDDLRKIVR